MSQIITEVTGDMRASLSRNSDGTFTTSHSQDISAILDNNRQEYNRNLHSTTRFKSATTRVASIPMVIALEWMKEGINVMAPKTEDMKRIKAKLNSPEYQYLRTCPGRI